MKLHEKEGVLTKRVSPENKSKFIYSLTEKGIDLLPVIIEIMGWGAKYHANYPHKELGKRIQKNKARVIKEYLEKLKKHFIS